MNHLLVCTRETPTGYLKVLKSACETLGNTVVIVEHEEEVMREADEIIDMGPYAGTHGGEVVFQGNHDELMKQEVSLTAKYLTGREKIEIPCSEEDNGEIVLK